MSSPVEPGYVRIVFPSGETSTVAESLIPDHVPWCYLREGPDRDVISLPREVDADAFRMLLQYLADPAGFLLPSAASGLRERTAEALDYWGLCSLDEARDMRVVNVWVVRFSPHGANQASVFGSAAVETFVFDEDHAGADVRDRLLSLEAQPAPSESDVTKMRTFLRWKSADDPKHFVGSVEGLKYGSGFRITRIVEVADKVENCLGLLNFLGGAFGLPR